MTTPRRAWTDTGFVQETPSQMHRLPDFDPRTGDHAWVVITAYSVVPAMWTDRTATPHLDMENLMSVQGPACFYCEQPYTDRTAKRRCKGKP